MLKKLRTGGRRWHWGGGRRSLAAVAGSVGGVLFEDFDGLAEAASAGVHDHVDGPAAAPVAVVEGARAVDAEDLAGEFPAGSVARVAALAELQRERDQQGLTDGGGAGGPREAAEIWAHEDRRVPVSLSRSDERWAAGAVVA